MCDHYVWLSLKNNYLKWCIGSISGIGMHLVKVQLTRCFPTRCGKASIAIIIPFFNKYIYIKIKFKLLLILNRY